MGLADSGSPLMFPAKQIPFPRIVVVMASSARNSDVSEEDELPFVFDDARVQPFPVVTGDSLDIGSGVPVPWSES